eukprot:3886634-Prymnesium_polylepis.1
MQRAGRLVILLRRRRGLRRIGVGGGVGRRLGAGHILRGARNHPQRRPIQLHHARLERLQVGRTGERRRARVQH